jgi:hypothetical protein
MVQTDMPDTPAKHLDLPLSAIVTVDAEFKYITARQAPATQCIAARTQAGTNDRTLQKLYPELAANPQACLQNLFADPRRISPRPHGDYQPADAQERFHSSTRCNWIVARQLAQA